MNTDKTTGAGLSQLVLAFCTAVLGVLVLTGVTISPELQGALLVLIAAGMALAAELWRRWSVARSRVVEETPDGRVVIAGEANELPTGAIVREDLGEREPRRMLPDTTESE